MCAEGSRHGVAIAALGDGRPGEFDLAAVKLLGMSQHRKGALVDCPAGIDFDARVILGRLLTTSGFGRQGLCGDWSN